MRQFLKRNLPPAVVSCLRYLYRPGRLAYEYCLIKRQPSRYVKIIEKLKHKDKIKVAFFALQDSVWKYDSLYRLMCEHPRFEPVIVVCPVVNWGFENMLDVMERCYDMFQKKGYNVVRAYDASIKAYLDVKKEINPDIVFYTNPYRGLIDDRYFITNYLDRLTCYVPYFYGGNNNYQYFFNQFLHNIVWKLFAETGEHKKYYSLYGRHKGLNVEVTGYPGIEPLLDKTYKCQNPWKIKDKSLKRIIWAPHHTFTKAEVIHYSCFLEYYQFMLDMAKKYENQIQIAFKPHPLLKAKLECFWGKEKADDYYKKWEDLPNGMFCDGNYTDLFVTSDAMIHDSGSFMIEYLYTLKPVMRTIKDVDPTLEFNDFGKDCYSVHYHAKSGQEIEEFILNVIDGQDSLKEKRVLLYNEKLFPSGNRLPSDNMLQILEKNLGMVCDGSANSHFVNHYY